MELGEITLGIAWHVTFIFNCKDQAPTTQVLSHTSRDEGNGNTKYSLTNYTQLLTTAAALASHFTTHL